MSVRKWSVLGLIIGALLLPARLPAQTRSIDWNRAQAVSISMGADYQFSPQRIELRRGVAYRLRFVNRSTDEWHDFTAPELLKSAMLGNPTILDVSHTQLSVPPGGTRELYLVPDKSGQYHFHCSDHDWAGMDGEITVK